MFLKKMMKVQNSRMLR